MLGWIQVGDPFVGIHFGPHAGAPAGAPTLARLRSVVHQWGTGQWTPTDPPHLNPVTHVPKKSVI